MRATAWRRLPIKKNLRRIWPRDRSAQYYIAPFIDYSDPDGLFRKQRIAIIDGEAFASHLAISEHWMVHYLSAGMAQHEERRAEEAELDGRLPHRFRQSAMRAPSMRSIAGSVSTISPSTAPSYPMDGCYCSRPTSP